MDEYLSDVGAGSTLSGILTNIRILYVGTYYMSVCIKISANIFFIRYVVDCIDIF